MNYWIEHLDMVGTCFAAVIAVLLPIELICLARRRQLARARLLEMAASISPLLPTLLSAGLVLGFIGALYTAAAWLAPWQIPSHAGTALLALLATDFLYYWDHRAGHENRSYWALAHSVHHSSPAFDQTTALRVSFIDGFISPWFYLPLVLLGFDPLLVLACFGVILGYQQWLHTELVDKLPLFDGWLNTPSNHRVHHGRQPLYLDRNYGAILMIWDRWFGTYQAEIEAVDFGLTRQIASVNPLTVHLAEARTLCRDLRSTPNWADRLRRLWHRPDWQPRGR